MRAEILCVGTELLLGDTVNTNAAYIARGLAGLGISVYHQTVVGDNPGRLEEALKEAFSRAELVIMTGGLGPTYDDLTKETVAASFGRKMEMHAPSLERIRRAFDRMGRTMTPNNEKQAMMPEGAIVFPNDHGTAPGLALEGDGRIAILLPGPPSEMQPMFDESVCPYLEGFQESVLVSHTLYLQGIGESNVEDMLREMMVSHKNPTIAPYAKTGEVQLRITASAKTRAEAEAMITPILEEIREILKDYIYGMDIGSLQNAAIQILREKGLQAAVAESCTGGMVSARLTDISGASEVYGCGVCTYSNEMKEKLLGVKKETLAAYGAVSPQTAEQMAEGVRKLSGADIGIGITGIAGPGGGSEEKPVGLVYIGISSPGLTTVQEHRFSRGRKDERAMIRDLAATYALRLLIRGASKA